MSIRRKIKDSSVRDPLRKQHTFCKKWKIKSFFYSIFSCTQRKIKIVWIVEIIQVKIITKCALYQDELTRTFHVNIPLSKSFFLLRVGTMCEFSQKKVSAQKHNYELFRNRLLARKAIKCFDKLDKILLLCFLDF